MINLRFYTYFVIFFLAIAVFLGPVRYTKGDSYYSLLASESLVQHGTLALDAYCPIIQDCDRNYRIMKVNGHYYDYLPAGSSVLSAPFVGVANIFGISMVKYEDYMQRVLVYCSLLAIAFLLYFIAVRFLSTRSSVFISLTFLFGTSIISTLGAALWSHNIAMMCSLSAILFSLKLCIDSNKKHVLTVALFLFLAYFCRPTLSLLAPFILLFIFSYDKKSAVKCVLYLSLFLGAFFLSNQYIYSTLSTPYYLHMLEGTEKSTWVLDALYGTLFSPSRGLFVFSPFLLILFLFGFGYKKMATYKKSWLWIAIAWPIVHWISISQFSDWWAGYAFGPRYMVDCLPGIFMLSIAAWPMRSRIYLNLFLVASIGLSIFINTVQGRFNIDAAINWNKDFPTDNKIWYPDHLRKSLFDWSKSQAFYPKRHKHLV